MQGSPTTTPNGVPTITFHPPVPQTGTSSAGGGMNDFLTGRAQRIEASAELLQNFFDQNGGYSPAYFGYGLALGVRETVIEVFEILAEIARLFYQGTVAAFPEIQQLLDQAEALLGQYGALAFEIAPYALGLAALYLMADK